MKRFVTLLLTLAACNGNDGKDTDTQTHTGTTPSELPQVWINEIMAANATTLQDEVGAYPDWIELYNPNDAGVALGGWFLTDDVTDPMKWEVPAGVQIDAGGFLVVFADSDTEEGDLHASFNLDADGGDDVGLFGPEADGTPKIDAVEDMNPAVPDVSLARKPDGGATWEIDGGATPGASND
ncbi:MAG: lamin tail domain-containing protein [Myxococcota bacterium]